MQPLLQPLSPAVVVQKQSRAISKQSGIVALQKNLIHQQAGRWWAGFGP